MSSPTKVVGRRTASWIIDFVPSVVLFVVGVRTFGTPRPVSLFDDATTSGLHASLSFGDTEYVASGADALKVFGLVLLWGLLNSVVLQGATGASIGKHLLGLRVVRPDGAVCGTTKALVRWLLLVVDAFPFFIPLVGFVMVLSSKGNRRLGDLAADTYVVRREHAGQPVVLDAYRPGPPPPPAEPQWDPARSAWVRWDGMGWVQHDPTTNAWAPLR